MVRQDVDAPHEPADDGAQVSPGRYRHFKGGEYEVLGVAKDSETMRELVVYRAMYGERGLWVRPVEVFRQTIERDGKRMPRFDYLGAEL